MTHTPGPTLVCPRCNGHEFLPERLPDGDDARNYALVCTVCQDSIGVNFAQAPELAAEGARLREALKLLANWTMRDGTRCWCPAGRNEDERRGKMPALHATGCEEARRALGNAP